MTKPRKVTTKSRVAKRRARGMSARQVEIFRDYLAEQMSFQNNESERLRKARKMGERRDAGWIYWGLSLAKDELDRLTK